MSTMTEITAFEDVVANFEDDTPCDSRECETEFHMPAHAAAWIIFCTCGHSAHWCEARLARYEAWITGGGSLRCDEHGLKSGVYVSLITPLKG